MGPSIGDHREKAKAVAGKTRDTIEGYALDSTPRPLRRLDTQADYSGLTIANRVCTPGRVG